MARGVDITELDILSTTETPDGSRERAGFKRQVIKLTCKKGYVKKPDYQTIIRLPDQVKPSAYQIKTGWSKEIIKIF